MRKHLGHFGVILVWVCHLFLWDMGFPPPLISTFKIENRGFPSFGLDLSKYLNI